MTPFRPKSRPTGDEIPSPAPMDAPAPRRAPKPQPAMEPEPDGDEKPGNGVTLEMLGYRDASKHCESCSHFDGQSACDLDATTPVDPDGGCEAHNPTGQSEDDSFGQDERPGVGEEGTDDEEYR